MKKNIFLEENEANIKEYTIDYYNEVLEDFVKSMDEFEKELDDESKKIGLDSSSRRMNHRESGEKRLRPRFLLENRTAHELKIPESTENIETFLKNFIRQKKEIVRLLILNSDNHVTDVVEFNKGAVDATNVTLKDIVKSLLSKNVEKFVYIHNHPREVVATFSGADSNFEYILNSVCRLLQIEFVDSFVITDWDFISRRQLDGKAPLEVRCKRDWLNTLSGIELDDSMIKEIRKKHLLLDALIGNINKKIESS